MPFTYPLPVPAFGPEQLGNSTQIKLLRFLADEEQWVEAGTPIAEVESANALMRIDANGRGVLTTKLAAPGMLVKPGDAIAIIAADGEEIPYDRPYSVGTLIRYRTSENG